MIRIDLSREQMITTVNDSNVISTSLRGEISTVLLIRRDSSEDFGMTIDRDCFLLRSLFCTAIYCCLE